MIKRLSIVVSLAVLGIGIWLVSRGHEVDRVCKVNSVGGGGTHFSHCMNLVSTYFLGYALCILGFIFLLMSILTMHQHFRRTKLKVRRAGTDDQTPDSSNPFRAVMSQNQPSSKVPDKTSSKPTEEKHS